MKVIVAVITLLWPTGPKVLLVGTSRPIGLQKNEFVSSINKNEQSKPHKGIYSINFNCK
jgi:hypothetical protein